MSSNLLVEDKDIKKSKSNFSMFTNELIKYEGKYKKLDTVQLTLALQIKSHILDAIGYQVLNAVCSLNYSTSRQITQYINTIKKISVDQTLVSKKLKQLNDVSAIVQQSFITEENPKGTNMKFYCLDKNGSILLKGSRFNCLWKATDSLKDVPIIKSYLIRNQYYLKLYEELGEIEDFNIYDVSVGVGLTYNINNKYHIVLPVRSDLNYKENVINTIRSLEEVKPFKSMLNKEILILSEDANHSFEIYKALSKNKLMNNNIRFVTDLKLFERELINCFVQFSLLKNPDGSINVKMKEDPFEDFINK